MTVYHFAIWSLRESCFRDQGLGKLHFVSGLGYCSLVYFLSKAEPASKLKTYSALSCKHFQMPEPRIETYSLVSFPVRLSEMLLQRSIYLLLIQSFQILGRNSQDQSSYLFEPQEQEQKYSFNRHQQHKNHHLLSLQLPLLLLQLFCSIPHL